MGKKIAAVVIGAALAAVALPTAAQAGPCERPIHGGFEGVGHVCLGPKIGGGS